ncbi:MAG: electron transporter RnfD [Beggiatoa sp. IS2]|nr:MAG: electron transporter RnfD [Beggiatoa sp. IS2]
MTQQTKLQTSPHIHHHQEVPIIMRNVIYALIPICVYAIYLFGISALALMIVTTATCLLTEHFFCWVADKPTTLNDYSAIITGLLLSLTLPPGFPLWMGVVAGFVGIAMAKVLAGGLGHNVFNPALLGRAFVQAAFPTSIATWSPALAQGRFLEFIPSTLAWPFMSPAPIAEWSLAVKQPLDAFTGATPLAVQKFEHVSMDITNLFLGTTSGSVGETSALLILICGGYLAMRKMLDWHIVLAVLVGAFVTSGLFYWADAARYPSPVFTLFAGGMMLGAVFMATDMVASPVTPIGVWIYGLFIGFLTVIIRLFGGLSEGIMYAILLGNALSPLIDLATQPRVYGTTRFPPIKEKPKL